MFYKLTDIKNIVKGVVVTLKEFLVHLSNVKNKTEVRKYLLTGLAKTCPITTVAKRLTNANYSIGEWDIAAKKIGLTFRTAEKIVDATDGYIGTISSKMLRNKLLVAVGLPLEDKHYIDTGDYTGYGV